MLEIYILIILIISTLLTIQGSVSLWQMLTAWHSEQEIIKNQIPYQVKPAYTKFSILIPAYKEEKVIADTLRQLAKQRYPAESFEILLPLFVGDKQTVKEVQKAKLENPVIKIRPILFNTKPHNKPDGLNKILPKITGDYVVIFDAEDHVNPHLLSVINTKIVKEGRNIIQTGVRLNNWDSNWFTLHNCLEYFFWFSSKINWHARNGFTPLGGVGVFLPIEVLLRTKGWDANCLTEDAQLGLDCSLSGYTVTVLNNHNLDTIEEAPTTINTFVRQRTRWIQGFLQIFWSGQWRNLNLKNQINFLILFLFPLLNFGLYLWFVISIIIAFNLKLPMPIVLYSFLPLTILGFQLVISIGGVWELLRLRNQERKIVFAVILMLISYIPYQLLICFAGIRALIRNLSQSLDWEKTTHQNIHRKKELSIA